LPRSIPAPPNPARWRECPEYLFGLDLFNHGYYWEAHEVWEGLWHACGRAGTTAAFLKGLIKLAAAGVKVKEGVARGVLDHARRAAELFREVQSKLFDGESRYLGLVLLDLIALANRLAEENNRSSLSATSLVLNRSEFLLLPGEESL